ncbi:MAG: MraY family glycosyltransferase [Bacillota bacterium]|nr:MraY family glycosyltransferase [Bacillota bacterium]
MELCLVVFAVAFFITLFITPLVIRLAYRIGALDMPSQRKVHRKVMPRFGGPAVYCGFLAIAAYLLHLEYDPQVAGLLIGGTFILLLGAIDDIYSLPPLAKLLGQVAAAVLVVLFGVRVNFITNPFDGYFELGMMSIPVTIFWIVAVTNSINLIDGLDGLAAGISTIALLTISFIGLRTQSSMQVVLLSLGLAGAILGFLRYNFYPAKIFLGDSGSMFLGFTIAVLSTMGLLKMVTVYTFVIPVIILGVPIFDTSFAILRRYSRGKPIFAADKRHIHHRLLNRGLTHRQAVLALYCLAIAFGLSAVYLVNRIY